MAGELNRHNKEQIIYEVDGYFAPTAHQELKGDFETAFNLAIQKRIEALDNYRKAITQLTYRDFVAGSESSLMNGERKRLKIKRGF